MFESKKQNLIKDYELVIKYSDNGFKEIIYDFESKDLKKEMNNISGIISECLISNKIFILSITLFFRSNMIMYFDAEEFCSYHCRINNS